MPRLNTSAFAAERKIPLDTGIFGHDRAARWAEKFGTGPICYAMMNARTTAHGRISAAFRGGYAADIAVEIASELVALAAEGHTGIVSAVQSVYGAYVCHVGTRASDRASAARVWTGAITFAIAEAGYPLPPYADPCAVRPRLTVVRS